MNTQMKRLKQADSDSGAAEVATEGRLPVEEKRFQVEVTVEATGYLEVDAPDAETARKKILELTASIDFGFESDIDTTLFDPSADVSVDGVNEVEPEA